PRRLESRRPQVFRPPRDRLVTIRPKEIAPADRLPFRCPPAARSAFGLADPFHRCRSFLDGRREPCPSPLLPDACPSTPSAWPCSPCPRRRRRRRGPPNRPPSCASPARTRRTT